ncbi:MAG: hypothetical protein ACFE89_12130 [Candidatus Hodarchaeota archaeon]
MESEEPLMEDSSLIEPQVKWTKRTTWMVVVDLVVKPAFVLFIVASILFYYWRIVPGDSIALFISGSMAANQQELSAFIRALWGFDSPLPIQYGIFLFNIFSGRLLQTASFIEGYRPVGEPISAQFPNTLLLVLIPFLIVSFIFVVFYWFRRRATTPLDGMKRHLYNIVFSKFLWILLAFAFFWGALQLGLLGLLPLGGTYSFPLPLNPLAGLLDRGWHLIAPATLTTLLSVAVATHYFYQPPGDELPPLSHGLPRLLVWTVSISVPVEIYYNWYGIGRALLAYIFMMNFPGLLAILVTYILTFGLAAILLEGILRWTIYRNPVELHGQQVIPPEKSTLHRPHIIVGIVLVCSLVALAIAGQFSFTAQPWPRSAPLEYSLMSLLPLLMESVQISLIATVVGGLIGLGAYYALRTKLSWPLNYLLAFPFSVIVLTLCILPVVPALYISTFGRMTFIVGVLLSAGVIRKISNSNLGKSASIPREWAKSLIPLFVLYCLVGGAIAFVAGFLGFGFSWNLGWVVQDLLFGGVFFTNPLVLFIPGTLLLFFVFAFDFLWNGLRYSPATPGKPLPLGTTPSTDWE